MDPRSGIGKKIRIRDLDHISKSLETIFWVKILKFFDADADPASGIRDGKIRIRDGRNLDPG
jgi:hypothetical protein